jgi:hypothetical protein
MTAEVVTVPTRVASSGESGDPWRRSLSRTSPVWKVAPWQPGAAWEVPYLARDPP